MPLSEDSGCQSCQGLVFLLGSLHLRVGLTLGQEPRDRLISMPGRMGHPSHPLEASIFSLQWAVFMAGATPASGLHLLEYSYCWIGGDALSLYGCEWAKSEVLVDTALSLKLTRALHEPQSRAESFWSISSNATRGMVLVRGGHDVRMAWLKAQIAVPRPLHPHLCRSFGIPGM